MPKKHAPKRRQKRNARHPRSKSGKPVKIGMNVIEGEAAGSGEPTQSGDTQGLSGVPDATFESLKELIEEGQYLEAEAVEGVENAPVAGAGPVKTKEVPEDDVPDEYRVPDGRERQS